MRSFVEGIDNNRAFLALLGDICDVSRQLGTRSYVWGGLVVDVLSGVLLRPHHDLDCFTLELCEYQQRMEDSFRELGYTITRLDEFQMFRIDRDSVHAAFNPLTVRGDTASWHHVGKHGRIEFPLLWLDAAPRVFHGVEVYTSGARFEYAIKTHPELLNPEWRSRSKDRDAVVRLRRIIDNDGFADLGFLKDVVSITPFWVERGYPEYSRLVRIDESFPRSHTD